MRKLLTLTVLVLTVFSTPVFADWTKLGVNVDGNTNYVDFERIRKHGGYVYWWGLTDYLKPTEQGHLSYKLYLQGDCKLFRYKYLNWSFHKEPMGRGTGLMENRPDKEWRFPLPNSGNEHVLKSVCEYAK